MVISSHILIHMTNPHHWVWPDVRTINEIAAHIPVWNRRVIITVICYRNRYPDDSNTMEVSKGTFQHMWIEYWHSSVNAFKPFLMIGVSQTPPPPPPPPRVCNNSLGTISDTCGSIAYSGVYLYTRRIITNSSKKIGLRMILHTLGNITDSKNLY